MLFWQLNLIFIILTFSLVESAKILIVFPFPGKSQFIAGELFFKELAARGHKVTVVSGHPQKKPIPNFRDIPVMSIHDGYDDVINKFSEAKGSYQFNDYASKVYILFQKKVLDNPTVQELLKNEKFDLVIIEAWHTELLSGLGPHFDAPVIAISTTTTQPSTDDLVGNTSPLSYIPHTFLPSGTLDGIWSRWENLKLTIFMKLIHHFVHMPRQRTLFKQYFPEIKSDIDEVRKNYSLVLLNQHVSMSVPRPYVPNMIEVGGFFIKEKRSPLPQEMQNFIDSAKNGVIYFSMGSNVNSSTLPIELQETILKTFSSLPERVMWKYEKPDLPGKSDNVFISPWFPQSEILAQHKVKLFITHCGGLSTTEAVHFGKPLLGFPVFLDQFMNAKNAEKAGYGLMGDLKNIDQNIFRNLIRQLIDDQKYLENAQQASRKFHDRPLKPLDNAVYWTEYIIRHNGAVHLQNAGQKLSLIEYFNLDIFCIIFLVVILIITSTIFLIKNVIGYFKYNNKEVKQVKQKKH